jgi:hypothetical protein
MKIYTLGTLVATASASTPTFDWKPANGCSDSTGWSTEYPAAQSKHPLVKNDDGKKYCNFDGNNDYLILDKKFQGATQKFTVEVEFRTSFNSGNSDHGNWAFLDCDRSDHFNTFITPDGKLGFSTAGKVGNHNEGIHDMYTTQGGFNDGLWHTATFTYEKGVKQIWVNGILMHSVKDNSRTQIGWKKSKRYCFIGDGSEATNKDGARNKIYYQGDLAEVRYYDDVVAPEEASFMWGAVDGKCASKSEYGWPVTTGNGANPLANIDVGMSYCAFDGKKDYLSIANKFFEGATEKFSIRTVFRTGFKSNTWTDNWALLDCDRSEHFNVAISANDGKIVFSTAGGSDPIDDMFSNTKDLNDNQWHDVTVSYDKGVKTITIDGVVDRVKNDKNRNKIGQNKLKRFCFIGDGSEATTHEGSRNHIYFEGDIAMVAYVTGNAHLPTNSPYLCNAQLCQDWECDTWCACFDSEAEEQGEYVAFGCEEENDATCTCEE